MISACEPGQGKGNRARRSGAGERNRTLDLLITSELLLPTELHRLTYRRKLAARVRFELTNGFPLPVFKTGAIDRSAISPLNHPIKLPHHNSRQNEPKSLASQRQAIYSMRSTWIAYRSNSSPQTDPSL